MLFGNTWYWTLNIIEHLECSAILFKHSEFSGTNYYFIIQFLVYNDIFRHIFFPSKTLLNKTVTDIVRFVKHCTKCLLLLI